jgi:hypothetical protein
MPVPLFTGFCLFKAFWPPMQPMTFRGMHHDLASARAMTPCMTMAVAPTRRLKY